MIVGGDPANQQPIVELRARKARRGGARVVTIGPRPHPLESLDTAVRSAPGGLAAALQALQLPEAADIIVLWDEADLAAEPDAAAVLARRVADLDARRSSSAPTSTARACARSGCRPRACSRRPRRGHSTCC